MPNAKKFWPNRPTGSLFMAAFSLNDNLLDTNLADLMFRLRSKVIISCS